MEGTCIILGVTETTSNSRSAVNPEIFINIDLNINSIDIKTAAHSSKMHPSNTLRDY
jgi:hypothetical protein